MCFISAMNIATHSQSTVILDLLQKEHQRVRPMEHQGYIMHMTQVLQIMEAFRINYGNGTKCWLKGKLSTLLPIHNEPYL